MTATTTEERLEASIRRRPERWIAERGESGKLLKACGKDTGRLWFRVEDG